MFNKKNSPKIEIDISGLSNTNINIIKRNNPIVFLVNASEKTQKSISFSYYKSFYFDQFYDDENVELNEVMDLFYNSEKDISVFISFENNFNIREANVYLGDIPINYNKYYTSNGALEEFRNTLSEILKCI